MWTGSSSLFRRDNDGLLAAGTLVSAVIGPIHLLMTKPITASRLPIENPAARMLCLRSKDPRLDAIRGESSLNPS
jgi:hypothetical protein